MVLNHDGCHHPRWRSNFAANGKMHEFCIACGAERRISRPAEGGEAARLRNGLRWMRHVAAMNATIESGPDHMRALALLAEKLLDGAELEDYDSCIDAARGEAQEPTSPVVDDAAGADGLQHGDSSPAEIVLVLPEQDAEPVSA